MSAAVAGTSTANRTTNQEQSVFIWVWNREGIGAKTVPIDQLGISTASAPHQCRFDLCAPPTGEKAPSMAHRRLCSPTGAVEVWRSVNATGMAYPMHVHGVRMSLLSRDGSNSAVQDQGLRNTFVVDAIQTVIVAVQTPDAASPTPLMLHCHILEREDTGLMGQFITV